MGITWFPARTQVWIEVVVELRSGIQIDECLCVLKNSVQSIMCSAAGAIYTLCVCVCVCKHTCKGNHMVAQLVKAFHYKLEICRFNSQWCQWNFSLTESLQLHYGPAVDSASNRYKYQEHSWGYRWPVNRADNLTTFKWQMSWNMGASTSCNPQSQSILYRDYLTFLYIHKTPPFHKWDLFPYSD